MSKFILHSDTIRVAPLYVVVMLAGVSVAACGAALLWGLGAALIVIGAGLPVVVGCSVGILMLCASLVSL